VSLLAVNLTSAEVLQANYEAVDACTSDGPAVVVTKWSRSQCALAGVRDGRYREFTFDETTKDCSLYKRKPLLHILCRLYLEGIINAFSKLWVFHNNDNATKDCSLYKHKPLFYASGSTCSAYMARHSIRYNNVRVKKFDFLNGCHFSAYT